MVRLETLIRQVVRIVQTVRYGRTQAASVPEPGAAGRLLIGMVVTGGVVSRSRKASGQCMIIGEEIPPSCVKCLYLRNGVLLKQDQALPTA